MTWPILYTRQAQKDARKLALAGLKDKALKLLDIVHHNPSPFKVLQNILYNITIFG